MEDHAEGRACKDTARLAVSLVTMLMLVWIIHTGYRLATETRTDTVTHSSQDSYITLVFGIVTAIFGLVSFIVGLTVVAELALDFTAWLHVGTANNGEKEQKRNRQVFLHASVTMVSMLTLTWAIYMLAAAARKDGTYNRLAFLVGIITMAFGFIYFIIGITILADSALHLSGRLQPEVIGKTDESFAV